ncbi:MAG TPA: PfkB family carbohydrate kinase [Candidatus Limnocylindria bacterium]|nr:PfkB family carbohydrate kinase [Candidatus Limnocylindria bacterium]
MSELLIVGGLTVDRFVDGTSAPGGSVLHSGRAAVAEGVRPAILTIAGDEPEARDGLAQLGDFADVVAQPSPSTTTYGHHEETGRRVLVLEAVSAPLDQPAAMDDAPSVALLGPIASELTPSTIAAIETTIRPRCTVMLIQGWLRHLVVGEPVRPLPLDAVSDELWTAFGSADAIVVSTEDLAEAPEDPFAQAAAVRERLGSGPVLVLTLGAEGYLLDDPSTDRVIASVPRRVVDGVPMVGAGDTFGAALAIHLVRADDPIHAADAATEAVIRMLEARR